MICRFDIDDRNVVEWRWFVDDLNRIPEMVSGLVFEEGRCEEIEELNVNENENEWKNVRSIEVERNGLKGVRSVNVNGLNELELLKVESGGLKNVERIVIESNSLNGEMVFDVAKDVWKNVKSIEIGSGCLRRVSGEWIDLSGFEHSERIEIGSDSVNGIVNLRMNGLNVLNELEIGSGSLMTIERIEIGYDSLSSLSSLDMSRFVNLKELIIGSGSLGEVESLKLNGLERMEVGLGSLSGVKVLEIGDRTLNDRTFETLDLRPFESVERVKIGRDSLMNVESVWIDRNPYLREWIVGSNSLKMVER